MLVTRTLVCQYQDLELREIISTAGHPILTAARLIRISLHHHQPHHQHQARFQGLTPLLSYLNNLERKRHLRVLTRNVYQFFRIPSLHSLVQYPHQVYQDRQRYQV